MATGDFAGTVAIVTGAAGGIGSAVVTRLADDGATVVAVDRSDPVAPPAWKAAQEDGRVLMLRADVTRPDEAAAIAFTRCLGLELAPRGVRRNVVAPGSTDTPMLTALWDDAETARRHSADWHRLAIGYAAARCARVISTQAVESALLTGAYR